MKKTMLAILLCGVMLLGVTGCGTTNDFDIGNVSNIEINNNNDVTLSVNGETLKNTGVTLILEMVVVWMFNTAILMKLK